MSFKTWLEFKTKKLSFIDIQFIKLSAVGFTLMLAKLWEPILALEWYWYGLIFVLAAAKPVYKVFVK